MSYWKDRQKQLDSQLEKDEARLKKRLSSFYDAEYRKLEKEIAAYYAMYGEDKVIEYRNLMENLSEADRKQLIERMQDFVQRYPEYADMLPVRESIYKLNRLEGLQTSIRMQQLEIGAIDSMELRKHLERLAARSANAAAELMGFGKNFYSVNSDIVKKVVNTAWANGENFSKNIWKNRDKLANYLCTDMAQAFARGDSYDRIARNMKKRFGDVSRNDMYRLIYTEGTFVKAEASMQPFIEDFEKYKLSPVGDGKVCNTCSDVAKEVFDIKDRTPGVNFPPLHPWCRCTFTIEVEDWDKWMDDYEAKHSNGQSETVMRKFDDQVVASEEDERLNTGNLKLSDSTDKWAKEAKRELLKSEKSLRYRDKETMEVYGPKGKFIMAKRGGTDSVRLSPLDYPKLKNAVVTHNHPSEGSFSYKDIRFLKNMPISELRVSTVECVYYIRKPKKWPDDIKTSQQLESAIKKIRKELRPKYEQMYNNGEVTKVQRHKMYSAEVNKIFAERYGFDYGRETYE